MTILLPQLLSALGKTYASLRAKGVWELEISTMLAVVSFFKQPGVLQIQKISTSLLSSRQNTSLILLSGKPSAAAPNPFFGLPFFKSKKLFKKTLCYNSPWQLLYLDLTLVQCLGQYT
jgi:hypothetical protein